MSAPDTNVEKQEKRHRPSLWGIKGAMVFGALMLIAIIFYALYSEGDSGATAYEADGGQTEQSTQGAATETVEGTTTVDGTVADPATGTATGD